MLRLEGRSALQSFEEKWILGKMVGKIKGCWGRGIGEDGWSEIDRLWMEFGCNSSVVGGLGLEGEDGG